MTLTARVILVTLPVATVMATASTVAVLKTPWNVLHGTAGALVALGQWHLAPGEPAAGPTEPALAAELAAKPPLAVAAVKRAIREGLDQTFEASLSTERREVMALLLSADFSEGVAAFLEKRTPRFEGR